MQCLRDILREGVDLDGPVSLDLRQSVVDDLSDSCVTGDLDEASFLVFIFFGHQLGLEPLVLVVSLGASIPLALGLRLLVLGGCWCSFHILG